MITPPMGSVLGTVAPSGRVIRNEWMIPVKNKNSSCRAIYSPRQTRRPEEVREERESLRFMYFNTL